MGSVVDDKPLLISYDSGKWLKWYMPLPPMPKPRQTQRSKWRNVAYNEWAKECSYSLKSLMGTNHINSLPPQTPLWMSGMFAVPKGTLYRLDLDNLVKAVKDIMQKILFPNDAWVVEYREPIKKVADDTGWFRISVGVVE